MASVPEAVEVVEAPATVTAMPTVGGGWRGPGRKTRKGEGEGVSEEWTEAGERVGSSGTGSCSLGLARCPPSACGPQEAQASQVAPGHARP